MTALLFAVPLLFLAVRNVTDGTYWEALASTTTLGPLRRSLVLATLVSTATAILGTASAWLVIRT
ncbi:MAG TPA: hypothetical protein VGA69_12645, partial [Nitriliruptorales bacterium]